MPLNPDTLALTAVLALLTALGPMSTDMYLPSLPDMTELLDSTVTMTQLTLSLYLVGFAAGQIVYGPISDRVGRRPVLLWSLALMIVATAGSAAAPSMEMLIAARLVQGLGAAGSIVLARSIVRDLYSGSRAAQELARMGMMMGLVPAIAPLLGGILHQATGWRSVFVVQALLALAAAVLVRSALPETLRQARPEPLTLREFPRIYGGLMHSRAYRVYVGGVCFLFSGLFAFLSSSSYVLQEVYGMDELTFSAAFGMSAAAYVFGSILGQKTAPRIGIDRSITWGAASMAAGGILMLGLILADGSHPAEVIVPMMLYMVGIGLAVPSSFAGAMMPFPQRAGAASSLMGFTQMSCAAATGIVVGHYYDGSALPLAISVAAMGFGALAVNVYARSRGIVTGPD